jgi:cysteine dioxygenase
MRERGESLWSPFRRYLNYPWTFARSPPLRSRTVTDHLTAMFHYLDRLTGRPNLARLANELWRFDVKLKDVAKHICFTDKSYKRNLVHAAPNYHVWLLCWKNGQRSPIHDHAGSSCVVRVLRGVLTETLFEPTPNGHIKATTSRDFAEGCLIGSEDTDIHQVSNLQAGDAELITLHVYAPPLLKMNTYSLNDTSRGFEVWEVEFSDAAGI